VIQAGNGNDVLDGGNGDDLLVGGFGVDTQTGGSGADTFKFTPWDTGTLASADRITDFVSGVDRIDLSAIDTNYLVAGVQHFSFIGSSAFSNTGGELRYAYDGVDTHVLGDMDGDGAADIEILLTGNLTPLASDFVL
jgi:Ca2+-binding RTX toxin-like protein